MLELVRPGFLWLLALILPLVLLYILKARRRPRRVSAVWLWEEARRDLEARVPFRRLRRDWLLLLQLLILALLVLSAAEPVRRLLAGPGGTTVVVLDGSASLSAGSRFEDTRAAVADLVDGVGEGDRMALVWSAAAAEVLVPLTEDRRVLRRALDGLGPSASAGELTPALELATSLAGAEGEVVVITDGAAVPAGYGARILRVGESAGNAGIVALGVSPSDLSGRDHQVFVRLRNARDVEAPGRLTLRVDGLLQDAADVVLPADGEGEHTFELLGTAEGSLEVIWQSTVADALAADDRAFWELRAPEVRSYRVRGPADSYLRRALAAHPDWREVSAGEADLEVMVGEDPGSGGQGPPFLWIDPVAGRLGEVPGGIVLSWDRTHPALRFVELRAVRFARLHARTRPSGARVLAETEAGPLILEGLRGERRYLAWGFDPMASDLPLRASFPLMVHNALEYLAPAGGGLPGGVNTGAREPLPWPSATPVTVTSPSGREVVVEPDAGVLRLPALDETGTWRLASVPLDEGGAAEAPLARLFAASLLDAGESDLRFQAAEPTSGNVRPDGRVVGSETRFGPRPELRGLWRPLALAALLFLILEDTAYHRRWSP